MASTHGMTGIAGRSVYGISKQGVIQMTRMLAIEWADSGHPRQRDRADHGDDGISTGELLSDPGKRGAALSRIPSSRFATQEKIAAAVVYLASPAPRRRPSNLPVDGELMTVIPFSDVPSGTH